MILRPSTEAQAGFHRLRSYRSAKARRTFLTNLEPFRIHTREYLHTACSQTEIEAMNFTFLARISSDRVLRCGTNVKLRSSAKPMSAGLDLEQGGLSLLRQRVKAKCLELLWRHRYQSTDFNCFRTKLLS